MKVAILSDIHGNMQALESVMKDINKNGCEKVLCLGDLAMAGPEPSKVIDFVKSQSNWTVIQGNTDKMIAAFSLS
jgi:protein phosphatase